MNTRSTHIPQLFSRAREIWPDFEDRPQQEAMAHAVARALGTRSHLIVEAPTGVGKTLAYLIPAVLHARSAGRKAVISTHTKNLQEQLFCKDLLLVRQLLGIDFKAVMLKGRRNYLCMTRLRNVLASTASMFNEDGEAELHRINRWSEKTTDGDVESLGFVPRPEIWDMVCSEPGVCRPKICGSRCFFQRAREEARAADLVIMNHALFFTLLARQDAEDRFIFENDFVIFDEAHTLEAVAAASAGGRLSRNHLSGILWRLYNARTRKGLLSRQKKGVKSLCTRTQEQVQEFFDEIYQAAVSIDQRAYEGRSRVIRVRNSHLVLNSLDGPLQALQVELKKVEETTQDGTLKQELNAVRSTLLDVESAVDDFLRQSEPGFTYWIDCGKNRDENVTLCSSPSDVGEFIGPRLFREEASVILTSATLSVNGTTEYFQRRIGAGAVQPLILDSPFDHSRQMKLCIARDMPEPESEEYARALPSRIMQSIDRSGGKALVLFTNSSLMRSMAELLRGSFEERDVRLLVQGPERSRHVLLEEFKNDVRSVLFGLDSFWMGVDVPGESLEHVVITKLPFAVPNHPLIEARLESIAQRGGNAFLEYTLPEAVLKFRQGSGRLIRSRMDTGMITVLDSRILRKSYGRVFLTSIPRCPVELISSDGESEYLPSDEW
ncbi:MAG: helicase c2 [Bacteroidetes bacterium]|nr:helicase c2 [Bacteroidota bacterium]